MYRFQATIHARPAELIDEQTVDLPQGQFQTLCPSPSQSSTPLIVSFEQAVEALSALPRMFIELDGSFVWTATDGDSRRQVDGVLYDRDDRLLYVELQGVCTQEEFDSFLATFGWPETTLMFQLRQEAVYLTEDEFRRFVRDVG